MNTCMRWTRSRTKFSKSRLTGKSVYKTTQSNTHTVTRRRRRETKKTVWWESKNYYSCSSVVISFFSYNECFVDVFSCELNLKRATSIHLFFVSLLSLFHFFSRKIVAAYNLILKRNTKVFSWLLNLGAFVLCEILLTKIRRIFSFHCKE